MLGREIARDLPITRSAVSEHLQVIKDGWLVTDRAEGTRRIYSRPCALAILRTYLDTFWQRSLDAFKAAAEKSTPRRPP